MLKIENVTIGYCKENILQNISLEANRGEILCLIGKNG